MPEEARFGLGRSLLFSAFLFVAFFSLLELSLRLLGLGAPVAPMLIVREIDARIDTDISLPFMAPDPDLFWAPIPGWRGDVLFYKGAEPRLVSINSMGLRGKEIASPKPKGRRRVVCFGDSITFGYGVADAESYPAQLSSLLTPQGVDVVDAGVTGYTSYQVLGLSKRLLPRVEADVATFLIGWNDTNKRPVGDREYARRVAMARPMEGLLGHFALYRALKGASVRAQALRGLDWKRGSAGHRATALEYADNLRGLVEECRRTGVRPVFVALPHRRKPGEDVPPFAYAEVLASSAAEMGVPLLDPRELAAGSAASSNEAYYLDSLHLNREGNELLARAIAAQLSELHLP